MKTGNPTSWYQFIDQKIGGCQAFISPKRKPQYIVVGSRAQKLDDTCHSL